ncbi:MAG: tetratricopeptide repeat protein [Verrucomicrobiota bacterium]
MKKLIMLWMAVAAAAGVPPGSAQETPPSAAKPRKPQLDDRSVLVTWTNEGARRGAAATNRAVLAAASPVADAEMVQWIRHASELAALGKLNEAIEAYKRAVELYPSDKRARFGLGTTYIQLERYRDALAVLEPMAEEFAEDYSLKNNIAWLYATAKDHSVRDGAKAVRMAQEALLLAPNDYHVWSTLSEGYYVAGQYDKALRAAEEALKLARLANAGGGSILEYRRQVDKGRKAVQAMSLVE